MRPSGAAPTVLTFNGSKGSFPVTVTQTAFGISNILNQFTDNGIGNTETAAVTFGNGQAVTTTNTAKPGDTLAVWGTGLGPTPSNGSDTAPRHLAAI